MNKETSIYLDVVRFSAACAVFFSHLCGMRFTDGLFWQMGPYGAEAVDIFFVLSGFVIAYVYDQRESTPLEYSVSRLARIYSVALPALVATFILDAIGRHADPTLYGSWWGYQPDHRTLQAVASLFFVQEFWHFGISPGSDLPYWSLGFEVWYYVIFGVAVFAPKKWRIPAVALILVIVGPGIAILFPLWLMGVAAYRISTQGSIKRIPAAFFCLAPIAIWAAYEWWCWHSHARPVFRNWTGRSPVIQDWIIGSLFFVHLVGFRFISNVPGRLLRRFEKSIRWFAGATLTLYLFHLPLAQFIAAVSPWPVSSWRERSLIFLGVPMLVFVIADLTERRKRFWRQLFRRAIERGSVVLAPSLDVRS